MYTEKRLIQYLFLVFLAVLTGYTFLIRASFYDEEGEIRQNNGLRIMGENLAGDYALFRLLEQKIPAQEAYQPEKISDFLYKTAHTDKRFFSFASPMKAFAAVPLLNVPYASFCETWIFLGLLLFGTALYTFLPLKIVLPLMFALPAMFLSFTTGGWGVFIAAAVILALTLPEDYPKLAGFFGALCLIEPIVFFLIAAVFLLRHQKKSLFTCLGMGGAILFFSWTRYGAVAFKEAFASAGRILSETPCVLSSFASTFVCDGMPLSVALAMHGILAIPVIFFGYRLFLKNTCPQAVQDAYLCAALCLLSPFSSLGDYGVLYAGVAFFIRDSMQRGFLKGDSWFLFAAFASIYLEPFFSAITGGSIHMFLALVLLGISYRRSY